LLVFLFIFLPVEDVLGQLGIAQVGDLTLSHQQQAVKLGKDLGGRLVDGADH
jgi:hypothetical protein